MSEDEGIQFMESNGLKGLPSAAHVSLAVHEESDNRAELLKVQSQLLGTHFKNEDSSPHCTALCDLDGFLKHYRI